MAVKTEVRAGSSEKLMQDLVAVLEHEVEFLSFTVTHSKKRRHGQLQFEESFEVKQQRLPLKNGKNSDNGEDEN